MAKMKKKVKKEDMEMMDDKMKKKHKKMRRNMKHEAIGMY